MESVPVGTGATPGQRPRRSRFLTSRRTPASQSVMNRPFFAVLLSQMSLHLCRRSDLVMKDGARYSCLTVFPMKLRFDSDNCSKGALRTGVRRVGDLVCERPL